MRTVRVPVAAGTRLKQDQIALTLHALADAGQGGLAVDLQPRRVGRSASVTLDGLSGYD